jgi:methylmalonyl-CoA/ethylmalonyl-CoA epimerase
MGPIDHIGIAVRRLEDAIERYRTLGFAPDEVEDVPAAGVRVAFLPAGGPDLELLEPLDPDGAVARFLGRRGEGLHHVAFRTPDLRRSIRTLGDLGVRFVDPEPKVGARGRLVAFVHPRSALGVLLELIQR